MEEVLQVHVLLGLSALQDLSSSLSRSMEGQRELVHKVLLHPTSSTFSSFSFSSTPPPPPLYLLHFTTCLCGNLSVG